MSRRLEWRERFNVHTLLITPSIQLQLVVNWLGDEGSWRISFLGSVRVRHGMSLDQAKAEALRFAELILSTALATVREQMQPPQ